MNTPSQLIAPPLTVAALTSCCVKIPMTIIPALAQRAVSRRVATPALYTASIATARRSAGIRSLSLRRGKRGAKGEMEKFVKLESAAALRTEALLSPWRGGIVQLT